MKRKDDRKHCNNKFRELLEYYLLFYGFRFSK